MLKDKWPLIEKESGIDLQIFKVEYHHYKNPRNDKLIKTTVLNAYDAVTVIALTKDKKVLMLRQFRFGIGAYTLELPGGMVDSGEKDLVAAKRELKEETGAVGVNWRRIGQVQANPGFMTSKVTSFFVEDAAVEYALKLDEGEDVEVVTVDVEQVYDWIEDGKIQHPHTIATLFFARKILEKKMNIKL